MTASSAALSSAIVGLGTTGDLAARALADARLDAGLRVASLITEAPSFMRGLKQADALLQAKKTDAVVLLVPESCALVLVGKDRLPASRRAYAILESIAFAEEDVRWAVELALGEAGLEGREIGYASLAGADQVDGLESAFRIPVGEQTCALGFESAASASVTQAALALQQRTLPKASGSISAGSPFFVPEESRPFFATSRRHALVQATEGRTIVSLVMAEHAPSTPATPRYAPIAPMTLLPFAANSVEDLIRELTACAAGDLRVDARRADAPFAVAIVGRERESLSAEIRAAIQGIPQAVARGADWQTPSGSVFAPRPQGRGGKVAFVSPGAFSAYVGVAKDAFRLFPWLHEPGHGLPRDLGATFADGVLYPRWRGPVTADDRANADARLFDDHVAVFGASAATAVLFTRVVTETFGLRPDIAFGYSLGEGTMFSALGVWNDPDLLRERLHSSDLFRTRLAGRCEALRDFWRARGVTTPPGSAPWASYLVKTSVERVRTALGSARNVFLTIINTPEEMIIGGLPEEAAQLVADLDCEHMRLPYAELLHTEVIATEEAELARQHAFAIRNAPPTKFFSATGEPVVLETHSLARTLARMAREPLDFPALVNRVWDAGARVFVELGANASCSRLIAANLQGRPHMTVAIDRRGVDVQTSVVRCLARLHAHRVPVDLSPLEPPEGLS